MIDLTSLTNQMLVVCPIQGCNSDGVVFVLPSATPAQISSAVQIMQTAFPSPTIKVVG